MQWMVSLKGHISRNSPNEWTVVLGGLWLALMWLVFGRCPPVRLAPWWTIKKTQKNNLRVIITAAWLWIYSLWCQTCRPLRFPCSSVEKGKPAATEVIFRADERTALTAPVPLRCICLRWWTTRFPFSPVCVSSRASTLPVSPATCSWASAWSSSPPSPSCGCSTGTRNSTTRSPLKSWVSWHLFIFSFW